MANRNYWYPRHFKDYAEKTAHLSMIEHGAYTLLLDHYYQTGGKLMANAIALLRVCRAQTDEEKAAVQSVVDQFFALGDDGFYHNKRADEELGIAANVSAARSAAGKAGAKAKWETGKTMADAMASGMANAIANDKQDGWQNDAQPQPHTQLTTPIPPEGSNAGKNRKRSRETLRQFIDRCKVEKVSPIPANDPIFSYARDVGLPGDLVALCWFDFKSRYLDADKTQKDWQAHFRNAVKRNWFKLWYVGGDGSFVLTTGGHQIKREKEAAQTQAVEAEQMQPMEAAA